jgi:hypothetical protein
VVGIFSVGLDEAYRWKDAVQSPDEVRLWVAEGVANGMRPWFTKFAGSINDPRWLKPVEEIYTWCHGAEPYLRNERPLARVAIVYSQQTSWYCAGRPGAPGALEDAALGWHQALIEARIPFEMVHDRLLGDERLAALRTLILPNILALSDAQCDQLRRFVARGGGIVATSETSLCDETGAPRANFGLSDLFAANWKGPGEGPMHNAYLRLEHPTGHPLLKGLEEAPRVIHGVWRVEVAPADPRYASPLTLIPSYPDLPMEKVYPRRPRTDIAQAFMSEAPGGGRVAYFPWDIDRTFWEILSPDHGRLMRNAVEWATNEEPPVTVSGPGVLDVTLWKQRSSVTVHVVNLSNPMMMKGPVREILAVGPHRVRVRLPDGVTVRGARLLVAGTAAAFRRSGGWIEVDVPSIAAHEVVALDT